jgi:hypothetical protein
VVVLNATHLVRLLMEYMRYYHCYRIQLSLSMDCPEPKPVHSPACGSVIAVPEVGGLHHHYERRAACAGRRERASSTSQLEQRVAILEVEVTKLKHQIEAMHTT